MPLIVYLEDDLNGRGTTQGIVIAQIRLVRGVKAVTDLSAISRETLDAWLLPPDQTYRKPPRRRKKEKTPDQ